MTSRLPRSAAAARAALAIALLAAAPAAGCSQDVEADGCPQCAGGSGGDGAGGGEPGGAGGAGGAGAPCTLALGPTDVQVTSAVGLSSYPVAVSTGAGVAVAFDDDRAAPGGTFYGPRQVLLTELDLGGAPTRSDLELTSTALGDAHRPRLAAAADGYGVVFALDAVSVEGVTTRDVYFAPLGADLTLAAPPAPIATGDYPGADLAWSGEGFGVAFSGRPTPSDPTQVYFVPLAPDGTATAVPVPIADASDDAFDRFAAIVWDGASFAVAWQDRRAGFWEIRLRQVGPDGTPLGDELIVESTPDRVAAAVRLVWTGVELGVVYSSTKDGGAYGPYQVYLDRVAADGVTRLGGHRLTITTTNADTPAVAWWRGRYWVAHVDKATFVDPPPDFSLSAGSSAIDGGVDLGLPYNGAGQDIGAVEHACDFPMASPAADLWLVAVDPSRGPVERTLVSSNAGFSASPSLAAAGDDLLVTWFDDRTGDREIYSRAIRCD